MEIPLHDCRTCLRLETTRGRRECRSPPSILFGLYTSVAGQFNALTADKRGSGVQWAGKAAGTHSDVISAVRRCNLADGIVPRAGADSTVSELPPDVLELLRSALAPAW